MLLPKICYFLSLAELSQFPGKWWGQFVICRTQHLMPTNLINVMGHKGDPISNHPYMKGKRHLLLDGACRLQLQVSWTTSLYTKRPSGSLAHRFMEVAWWSPIRIPSRAQDGCKQEWRWVGLGLGQGMLFELYCKIKMINPNPELPSSVRVGLWVEVQVVELRHDPNQGRPFNDRVCIETHESNTSKGKRILDGLCMCI